METMTLPKMEGRVRLFNDKSGKATTLLAFADLVIADVFVIKNIRVLKRTDTAYGDEPFVTFPAEKGKSDDKWYDVAHPITAAARNAANAVILAKYQEALAAAPK